MSGVSHYEPCPKCRDAGRDSRGDNLVVYRDSGSHCFACGYHAYPTHYIPRVKEDNVPKSLLPVDFTREVPTSAWKWLLQYGLGYKYWEKHCGYSEAENRLVFTLGDPVSCSIGRFLGEPDKRTRKWYCWGDCHKHTELVGKHGPYTVLVEDIVSAHKVGHITETIPLFGTVVHPCHVYSLRDGSNRPVVLWLDADQGGSSMKTANRLQSLVNRPVYVKHTKEDPKCLSFEQIKEELNDL